MDSYEGKMLENLKMPPREEVEKALLKSLFKHNGVIKEFGIGEEIVEEIANDFNLTEQQRNAYLETIYRKENRVKRSSLWNRLLFRSADNLAKEGLISRPTKTILLTQKREWMLTENGYDEALKLLGIPSSNKEILSIKSFEVQKLVNKLITEQRPINYNPIDNNKRTIKVSKETTLRNRGFRQAVIGAYDYKCAVCGMKINSPDALQWEVEAAHIVPHSSNGRDDVWNGLALCHLHHWAFDVGWFTLQNNFKITVSRKVNNLADSFGRMGNYEFIKILTIKEVEVFLPERKELYPHKNSLEWHRQNVFHP